MPRNDLLYLEDMLTSAEKVERYTEGLSLEAFMGSDMVVDATLHNLEIIGEAAKGVSSELKQRHPQIDWRGMARFRDILAHHYFGVKLETVWDVVENEIPPLISVLRHLVEGEDIT